ncbi:MAG: PilZ domain-containing protein [Candidatus Binatia bacterium]
MKHDDDYDLGDSVMVLPLAHGVANDRRKETRCAINLPLRLTSGSGETIPAVICNLSAGGLLATADVRFSLLLPPPNGARFDGEFFLDDVEVRNVLLEVVRINKQSQHLIDIGCQFVQPPPALTTNIRARVGSRGAPVRRLSL